MPQPAGPVMTQMCLRSEAGSAAAAAAVEDAMLGDNFADTGEAASLGGVGGRTAVVDIVDV